MPSHLRVDLTQKLLNFKAKLDGKGGILVSSTPQIYSVEECRKALVVFIMCDEQPFKIVDGYGFKLMCKKL